MKNTIAIIIIGGMFIGGFAWYASRSKPVQWISGSDGRKIGFINTSGIAVHFPPNAEIPANATPEILTKMFPS